MKSFKKSMDKVLKTESNEKYNIENIQKITNIKSKDKINSLIEFVDNILINMEKYYSDNQSSILFKYKDEIYFEIDLNNFTWCKNYVFWEKIETEFELNYKETSVLIHYMLETHLKRKVPSFWNPYLDPI